jgi:hypothetical protein
MSFRLHSLPHCHLYEALRGTTSVSLAIARGRIRRHLRPQVDDGSGAAVEGGPRRRAHDRGECVMARRKSLRSQLYRAAWDLGNVQAARGDPTSYGKRVVRRKVYRTSNGINRRVLKDLGL